MFSSTLSNVLFQLTDSIIICSILIYSLHGFLKKGINNINISKKAKSEVENQ